MAPLVFPFEILLEIVSYLDQATLNSLIRSHKGAAVALTRRLYDWGLRLEQGPEWLAEDLSFRDRSSHPEAVFTDRVWQCAASWKSDLVTRYLLNRFSWDSTILRLEKDPYWDSEDDQITSFPPLLHLMTAAGNLGMVRALIEAGGDPDGLDEDLCTPLHHACRGGHEAIARYLVDEAGADILARDSSERSVIHCLPGFSDGPTPSFISWMVEATRTAGADPFAPDPNGDTPLHVAARVGHKTATRVFLESGADPMIGNGYRSGGTAFEMSMKHGETGRVVVQHILETRGDLSYRMPDGSTLLHLGISAKSDNTIRYMIECGADVTAVDNDGETPLHRAVDAGGNLAAVDFLISAGADPSAKDNYGVCPLERAYMRDVYVLPLLQGTPRAWPEDHLNTRLWKAVAKCERVRTDEIKILLQLLNHSPSQESEPLGNRPLHVLCTIPPHKPSSAAVAMIRVLLEAGVNPSVRNRKGITAFHFAVWIATNYSKTDTVRLMLESTSIHGPDGDMDPPVGSADYDDAIEVLQQGALRAGSRGFIHERHRKTPIDKAVDSIKHKGLAGRARRLLGIDQLSGTVPP